MIRTHFKEIEDFKEFLVIGVNTTINTMLDVNGLIRVLHHLHITNAYFNYEGDGTVLADNDPFAVAEVYFVDVIL